VQEVKEQHIQQLKNLPNNKTVPSLCFKNHGQQKTNLQTTPTLQPFHQVQKIRYVLHIISACPQPYIHFQYSNFAIAITIQPIDHPPTTIYNVYSQERPIHAANLLPEHIPKLPAIFMGDLNAHHQWWYGSEATNTTQINSTRKHSERIVDWLEQYDFSLHNTQGTYTHFPRQSGASP
jgi:hypothetical protein